MELNILKNCHEHAVEFFFATIIIVVNYFVIKAIYKILMYFLFCNMHLNISIKLFSYFIINIAIKMGILDQIACMYLYWFVK